MSTLNVANITDGSTTVGTEYVVNGSAKAWVNYNISTVQDSFNISSLIDNAGGDHTANFTNSFSSANHVPTTGGRFNASLHGLVTVGVQTASSVDLFGMTGNATSVYLSAVYKSDIELVAASVHGDLA